MTAAFARVEGSEADVLFVGRMRGAPGQEPPLSWRDTWLITFTVSGRRRYDIPGTNFVVVPGTMAIFGFADTWHRMTSPLPEPWEALYVRFRAQPGWLPPTVFEQVLERNYRAQLRLATTRQRVKDAFLRLTTDAHARGTAQAIASLAARTKPGPPDTDDEARRALLLSTLNEIMLLARTDAQDAARLDARVRGSLEYMAANLAEPHTVESLARHHDLSASRFAHLFHEALGISPVRALRLMRLQQAALQLQHSFDTIETIAERTGFSSNSHLSREFRREFGVSPRDYRAGKGA